MNFKKTTKKVDAIDEKILDIQECLRNNVSLLTFENEVLEKLGMVLLLRDFLEDLNPNNLLDPSINNLPVQFKNLMKWRKSALYAIFQRANKKGLDLGFDYYSKYDTENTYTYRLYRALLSYCNNFPWYFRILVRDFLLECDVKKVPKEYINLTKICEVWAAGSRAMRRGMCILSAPQKKD